MLNQPHSCYMYIHGWTIIKYYNLYMFVLMSPPMYVCVITGHNCIKMLLVLDLIDYDIILTSLSPQIKSLQDENKRMKRMIQQRNSVRLSMCYDNISFTREQLALLEDRDQTIGDLQFSLDEKDAQLEEVCVCCLLYTSPSPRDATLSRMPSSA